jgi:uncharacterized protein YqgC (DUF456 family)
VFGAILVWALFERTTVAWVTLGVVAALLAATLLVKYLWPMRRMKSADVGTLSLVAGAVLGIVGFFVIPVVGLFIGFVLGIYLAEYRRLGGRAAWPSTKHSLKAVGLSILIELAAGLVATCAWVTGVVLT